MMNVKDLLPIGSVVLLRGGNKRLMVFGVKQNSLEDGKEYDYLGVFYPEGYLGDEYKYLFQHEDIEKVEFIGYQDFERDMFLKRLEEAYSAMDAEK